MPVRRETCTRPYTSPQECQVCFAPADKPCLSSGYSSHLKEVHVARYTLEYGEWTEVFDKKYRDKDLNFKITRYGR